MKQEMVDGVLHTFPDDATDEEISQALEAAHPAPVAAPKAQGANPLVKALLPGALQAADHRAQVFADPQAGVLDKAKAEGGVILGGVGDVVGLPYRTLAAAIPTKWTRGTDPNGEMRSFGGAITDASTDLMTEPKQKVEASGQPAWAKFAENLGLSIIGSPGNLFEDAAAAGKAVGRLLPKGRQAAALAKAKAPIRVAQDMLENNGLVVKDGQAGFQGGLEGTASPITKDIPLTPAERAMTTGGSQISPQDVLRAQEENQVLGKQPLADMQLSEAKNQALRASENQVREQLQISRQAGGQALDNMLSSLTESEQALASRVSPMYNRVEAVAAKAPVDVGPLKSILDDAQILPTRRKIGAGGESLGNGLDIEFASPQAKEYQSVTQRPKMEDVSVPPGQRSYATGPAPSRGAYGGGGVDMAPPAGGRATINEPGVSGRTPVRDVHTGEIQMEMTPERGVTQETVRTPKELPDLTDQGIANKEIGNTLRSLRVRMEQPMEYGALKGRREAVGTLLDRIDSGTLTATSTERRLLSQVYGGLTETMGKHVEATGGAAARAEWEAADALYRNKKVIGFLKEQLGQKDAGGELVLKPGEFAMRKITGGEKGEQIVAGLQRLAEQGLIPAEEMTNLRNAYFNHILDQARGKSSSFVDPDKFLGMMNGKGPVKPAVFNAIFDDAHKNALAQIAVQAVVAKASVAQRKAMSANPAAFSGVMGQYIRGPMLPAILGPVAAPMKILLGASGVNRLFTSRPIDMARYLQRASSKPYSTAGRVLGAAGDMAIPVIRSLHNMPGDSSMGQ